MTGTDSCGRQSESNDENSSKKEDNESDASAKWRRKSEGDSANNEAADIVSSKRTRRGQKKVVKREAKPVADIAAKKEEQPVQSEVHGEENVVKEDNANPNPQSDNAPSPQNGLLIRGGSTYISFDKVREENERRRKELEERKKRRKPVDIDVEDESFSDKPKRRKSKKGTFDLKVGMHIACRAPEDEDEYFWIAKVVEEPHSVKRQQVKVQWYDGAGLDERTYVETQLTDYIPTTSVFHTGFDLVRIKRLNRVLFVLGEDLEPYDLSDEE